MSAAMPTTPRPDGGKAWSGPVGASTPTAGSSCASTRSAAARARPDPPPGIPRPAASTARTSPRSRWRISPMPLPMRYEPWHRATGGGAGASMGGMTALSLVARHPGLARHMVHLSGAVHAQPLAIALRALQTRADPERSGLAGRALRRAPVSAAGHGGCAQAGADHLPVRGRVGRALRAGAAGSCTAVHDGGRRHGLCRGGLSRLPGATASCGRSIRMPIWR